MGIVVIIISVVIIIMNDFVMSVVVGIMSVVVSIMKVFVIMSELSDEYGTLLCTYVMDGHTDMVVAQ